MEPTATTVPYHVAESRTSAGAEDGGAGAAHAQAVDTGAGDGDDAGDDGPVSLAEATTTPDSEAKTRPLSGSEEPGAPTLVWGRAQAGGAKQAQPRSSERRGAAQAGAAGAAEHFHTSEGAGARDKQRAGEKLAEQVSGERGNNEGEPRVRWLQLH